jgi:predicted amidophosphoribosyltransferase
MPETICPFCRRAYPTDFKWCMDDGSELEQNIGQYDDAVDEIPKVPCPDCGEMIDPRDVYCAACGSRVAGRLPRVEIPAAEPVSDYTHVEKMAPAEPKVPAGPTRDCPICGARIALDDVFCGECGAKLEAATTPVFEPFITGKHCMSCAAGLETGEEFCGVCGEKVPPGFWSEDEQATVPARPPQPAGLSTAVCPNCGMEISAGDAFCGTCGQRVGTAPQPAPFAAPQPPAAVRTACPGCSADISPDDVFCGTCGRDLSVKIVTPPDLAGLEPEYELEPAPEKVVVVDPFGGRGMKKLDVDCPNCGLKIPYNAEVCNVCGYSLKQEPVPAEAGIQAAGAACPVCGGHVDSGDTFCGNCGASMSGAAAAPETTLVQKSIADMTAGTLVCPECGMEGQHEQEVCTACGSMLTTQAELDAAYAGLDSEPVQEPVYEIKSETPRVAAPYVPPLAPPPPADGKTEKICSCCGSACPPETEFCPNCGVDFN